MSKFTIMTTLKECEEYVWRSAREENGILWTPSHFDLYKLQVEICERYRQTAIDHYYNLLKEKDAEIERLKKYNS